MDNHANDYPIFGLAKNLLLKVVFLQIWRRGSHFYVLHVTLEIGYDVGFWTTAVIL